MLVEHRRLPAIVASAARFSASVARCSASVARCNVSIARYRAWVARCSALRNREVQTRTTSNCRMRGSAGCRYSACVPLYNAHTRTIEGPLEQYWFF